MNTQKTANTRRIRKNNILPSWTPEEKAAFRPPEDITVSQWADKNRILDRSSTEPGHWRTDRTPYLQEIMDQFTRTYVQKLVLCFGTQLGKTETIFNILGYCIDQDPAPAMIVYPIESLAESVSTNRIQPMMQMCDCLAKKYDELKSKRMELQFSDMYVTLVGANSPAGLSSKPIRYVFMDEVDKYPVMAGDDSDPRSLAKERLKAHPEGKIIEVSSPTYETGNIWSDFQATDLQKHYVIPCPHCGAYIELLWKQIKWPEDIHNVPQLVRDKAIYECQECGGVIYDYQKRDLLRQGKWIEINKPLGRVRAIGYQLSSLYSPWLTWGDIAYEFIMNKSIPSRLKNFINGWLAEPWRDMKVAGTSDAKFARHEWNRGIVPPDTEIMVMSVDVQKNHFWWEIRGWNNRIMGRLIDYGQAISWDDLAKILRVRKYRDPNGVEHPINRCLMDSGFRTDEVYAFCTTYSEVCMPCKGASTSMNVPYKISNVDRRVDSIGELNLVVVDTEYWKDYTHSRQKYPSGQSGAMEVFQDCPDEYIDHQKAEVKRIRQDLKRNGQTTERWEPISGNLPNHLLDTAVYNAVGADICGVRYLVEDEYAEEPQNEDPKEDYNWVTGNEW
jgi:phage terminase large subunit GpA-like protein